MSLILALSFVLQVIFALHMTGMGMSQSNSLMPNVSKAKRSVASVFEILDLKSKIDAGDNHGIRLANVKGDIKFHHLKFKYPTRPELLVFKDFCLSIHSGQVQQCKIRSFLSVFSL